MPDSNRTDRVLNVVQVTTPLAGENLTIAAAPDTEYKFTFDPATADTQRSDADLTFTLEDGGSVTITDFFAFIESTVDFTMTDGVTVSAADILAQFDIDLTPAGGRETGNGAPGAYDDGSADLLGTVDRLDKTDPFFWNGGTEHEEQEQGLIRPTIDFGTRDPQEGPEGLSLSARDVNESTEGFEIYVNLSFPAPSEITLVFDVSGSAFSLQQLGSDFNSDYNLELNGVFYTYDPAAGTLTIVVPTGTQNVAIPVSLVDDHISDGDKNITFTFREASNNVIVNGNPSATVTIHEDNISHDQHTGDNEAYVLDGPIISLDNVTEGRVYEGSGNDMTFQIGLTDPHTGNNYNGFNDNGLMSQDMTITINVTGGSATAGSKDSTDVDFHIEPSAELQALIDAGMVSPVLNPDGSFAIDSNGNITLTIHGQVNGAANGPSNGTAFELTQDNLDSLTVTVVQHTNTEETDAKGGETSESIELGIAGTVGNESQPARDNAGGTATGEFERDPELTIGFVTGEAGPGLVQESEGEVRLDLHFDKPIEDDGVLVIKFDVTGDAALWTGDAADKFIADFFLANNLPSDASIVRNADGSFTLTVKGSHFTAVDTDGDGQADSYDLTLEFPLNDEHITEEVRESLVLEVESIELTDSNGYTGTINGKGNNDSVVIIDDALDTTNDYSPEKDGPVVGINVNGAATDHADEDDGKDFEFKITLKDPNNPSADYQGYDRQNDGTDQDGNGVADNGNGNVLSQDMTVTLTVDAANSATVGDDYTLNMKELLDLEAAGQLSIDKSNITVDTDPSSPTYGNFTFNDNDNDGKPDNGGDIKITLNGMVGADGAASGHDAFDMGNAGDLKITATINNDTITELNGESIKVSVKTDGGNESTGSGSATATIDPDTAGGPGDSSNLNGPVISIAVTETLTESHATLNPDAPEDNNIGNINIDMTKAADEEIPMTIHINGANNNVKFGAESPAGVADLNSDVDYFLNGTWAAGTDADGNTCLVGTITVTMADGVTTVEVPAYRYDNGTNGTDIKFDMPVGGVGAELGYTVNDDLYEHEGSESIKVNIELGSKGTDANGNELAYGEATLADASAGDALTSNDKTSTITEDQRGGSLNPDNFDGPYVSISYTGQKDSDGNVTTGTSINETGGNSAGFKLSLTNPDGSGALFDDTVESVNVTLDFDGGKGLNMHDFFAPTNVNGVVNANGSFTEVITITFYDADGNVHSTVDYTVSGNANGITSVSYTDATGTHTNSGFTITVPKGAAEAAFDLPINDDPLSGIGNTDSNYDNATEGFELGIVGIDGNEARADDSKGSISSGTITIVDDSYTEDFGTTAGEGIQLGIVYGSGSAEAVVSGSNVDAKEGSYRYFGFKVYDKDGDAYGTSSFNNPYAGYVTGGKLPEALTVTLNLGDTASANGDITYSIGSSGAFYNALRAGQITITLADGTVVNSSNYSQYTGLSNSIGTGEITITFNAGTDLTALNANNSFQVRMNGDNITEYDGDGSKSGDHLYDGGNTKADESFEIELTDVKGNESSIKHDADNLTQNDALTGTVYDKADGDLSWVEGSGSFNDEHTAWDYTIKLDYTDSESTSVTGGNNVPGEDIHFKLTFTDSAAMQNGEEYNLSARELMNSLNNKNIGSLTLNSDYAVKTVDADGNPVVELTPAGEAALADAIANGTLDAFAHESGLIVVGGNWNDATVDGNGDPVPGNGTFDVYVPKESFPPNGELNFDVERGEHGGFADYQDGFSVVIDNPYANGADPAYDIKGEIVTVDDTVISADTDEKLVLYLEQDEVIHEQGLNGDNIHSYTVNFDVRTNGNVSLGVSEAASDLTFIMTLVPGSATLDTNTMDVNNALDSQVGDFGFADHNGNLIQYDSINADGSATSLETLLNADLLSQYGLDANGNPNVSVDIVLNNSGKYEFHFTVKEGFDLGDGVTINVIALDDSVSDSGEGLKFLLSNPKSADEIIKPVVIDREEKTTIVDETADGRELDGFAIAIGEGFGKEPSDGAAGSLSVPVYAYILDGNEIMTTAELTARFGAHVAETGYSGNLFDFIKEYYKPVQTISGSVKCTDGSAATNADYDPVSGFEIGAGNWTLVHDPDTDSYYFESSFNIRSIDDNLHENNEEFDIKLNGVSGNESRVVTEEEVEDIPIGNIHNDTTIKDVHNGPVLTDFGPESGVVSEPNDNNQGPVQVMIDANNPLTDENGTYYISKVELVGGVQIDTDGNKYRVDASGNKYYVHEDADGNTYYTTEGDWVYYPGADTVEYIWYGNSGEPIAVIGSFDDTGVYDVDGNLIPGLTYENGQFWAAGDTLSPAFVQESTVEGYITDGNRYEMGPDGNFTDQNGTEYVAGGSGLEGYFTEHIAEPKQVPFIVRLESNTVEPVMVWMDTKDGAGFATEGKDYHFGEGMYEAVYENGEWVVYSYNDDGSKTEKGSLADFWSAYEGAGEYMQVPSGDGPFLFTVIEKGDSSATFDVWVHDDNDDARLGSDTSDWNNGLVDENGKAVGGEEIGMVIKDMQGSEVHYPVLDANGEPTGATKPWYTEDANGNKVTPPEYELENGVIMDENGGPHLGFDGEYLETTIDNVILPIELEDFVGENINVTLFIEDINGIGGHYTITLPRDSFEVAQREDGSYYLKSGVSLSDGILQQIIDENPGFNQGDFYIQIEHNDAGSTNGGEISHEFDSIKVHGVWPAKGDNPWLVINGFEASDEIKEGALPGAGGESAGYDINFGTSDGSPLDADNLILYSGKPSDEDFTLNIEFRHGTSGPEDLMEGTDDAYGNINITLTLDAIKEMADLGGTSIHLEEDADGNISITFEGNGGVIYTFDGNKIVDPSGNTVANLPSEVKVDGSLPTAKGDDRLEGDENFFSTIESGDASGGYYDVEIKAGVSETYIEDNTHAKVIITYTDPETGETIIVDENFNHSMLEGQEVEFGVRLVLTDEDGNILVADPSAPGGYRPATATDSLDDFISANAESSTQIDINYGRSGDTATLDNDYSGDIMVTIPKDGNEGKFTVNIHNDNRLEGEESFTISASVAADNEKDIQVRPSGDVKITIDDDMTGPQIHWSVDHQKSDISEGGKIVVNLEAMVGSALTVVEEDVTLTFQLSSGTDGNPPLITIDEIGHIKFGGNTYTVSDTPLGTAANGHTIYAVDGNGNPVVTVDGAGNILFHPKLGNGTALGNFEIGLTDDVITEGDEGFKFELIATDKKGETTVAPGHVDDLVLKETTSGPKLTITPGAGSEDGTAGPFAGDPVLAEQGYATINVNFNGGLPTEETSTVTISIGGHERGMLVTNDTGSIVLNGIPGATIKSYDPSTGELVIELPNGVSAGDKLEVSFAVKDDSVNQERGFTVELESVVKGEMTIGSKPNYSSEWESETGASTTHGGIIEFTVTPSGDTTHISGNTDITVGGLGSSAAVAEALVDSVTVTVGDRVITFGPLDPLNPDAPHFEIVGGSVKVVYPGIIGEEFTVDVQYKKDAPADELKDAMLNTTVSAKPSGNLSATTGVKNETDPDKLDNIEVVVSFDDTSVVEGSAATGELTIKLPSLAGDDYDGKLGGDIEVTLQLSMLVNGSYPSRITIDGVNYNVNASTGKVTVTFEKDTALEADGSISKSISVTIADNSVLDNQDFTISITEVKDIDKVYEGSAETTGASIGVTDDATPEGPAYSIAANAVTEGADIEVTLSSTGNATWKQVANADRVDLVLQLEGVDAGTEITYKDRAGASQTAIVEADGKVKLVDVPHNANGSTVKVTIPTENLDGADRTVSITVDSITKFETVTSNEKDVTVASDGADGFTAALAAAGYDEANQQMMFSLTIAGVGMYATAGALAKAVDVNFDVSELTSAQLADLQGSFSALTPAVVFDDSVAGTLTVTLAEGTSLADLNGTNITIGGVDKVDGIPPLAITGVDADTETTGFTSAAPEVQQEVNGEDITFFGTTGNDTITGGAGDDIIFGGKGNDTLYGGAGNDTLYGGAGNDTLYGGAGDDIFMWSDGDFEADVTFTDIISDFGDGEDTLDLSGIAGIDVDGSLTADFDGGNLVLTINTSGAADPQQVIVLENYADSTTYDSAADQLEAMLNAQQIIINSGGM